MSRTKKLFRALIGPLSLGAFFLAAFSGHSWS